MPKKLTKEIIMRKLEENKTKIRSLGVTELVLFGSYAKGEQTSKSDLDFLVEFQRGRGLFDDYIHLLHFLEDIFQKKIDLGKKNLIRKELKPYILSGAQVAAQI